MLHFPKMQHFGKSRKILVKINSAKIQKFLTNLKIYNFLLKESAKSSAIFNENFEIRERPLRALPAFGVSLLGLFASYPCLGRRLTFFVRRFVQIFSFAVASWLNFSRFTQCALRQPAPQVGWDPSPESCASGTVQHQNHMERTLIQRSSTGHPTLRKQTFQKISDQ